MRVSEFPEQNCIFGRGQPEYRTLPAHRHNDRAGTITCCWRLSWRERLHVFFTGCVWQQVLTFNNALQPQLLSVEKPDMPQPYDAARDKNAPAPVGASPTARPAPARSIASLNDEDPSR